ncbi:hypothetical protein IEQ34_015129 [Dendrobium chrysotoxum]|uniref:NB-ARC domain-containing protein n=1 Tax=Dendrobium chrysotoxum TaxID=161865 RepID=A0AAV7GMI6_DENCH|nr:hypothetical protein IEQ34_015129 [Dendrobium chrysotoxum]
MLVSIQFLAQLQDYEECYSGATLCDVVAPETCFEHLRLCSFSISAQKFSPKKKGHGGMAKKTLLQQVYKDEITKEFDHKMWVCVSSNFNVKKVIVDILESLKKERFWEEVLTPLAYGNFCSRILVTNRMNSVVMMIPKVIKKKEIFRLEDSEEDECDTPGKPTLWGII